jgi:hypothetical protein
VPAFPVFVLEPLFVLEDATRARALRAALRRLPPLQGAHIRIERSQGLEDRYGPVHAGSFLRERRMVFDCSPAEFPRIFVHETFHFVWLRAGNPRRREWEELLAGEMAGGARGDLGWSAEWRKRELAPADVAARSRRWREYCCESFCDTAAWLYSGVARHPEYTLAVRLRAARRGWFSNFVARGALSI